MSQMGEKSRRFGDFTYQEIYQCAQQGWLAVIPTGCTEQQGPYLPVDFDTWFAETLMVAVGEKQCKTMLFKHWSYPPSPLDPRQNIVTLGVASLIFLFPSIMRLSKQFSPDWPHRDFGGWYSCEDVGIMISPPW